MKNFQHPIIYDKIVQQEKIKGEQDMMLTMQIILALLLFMAGASVFSFLNVVIYRVPRHMDFVHGRSHCPDCGHTLSGRDMVPVFSWCFLRGRCRYCHEPIAPRYTLVELLGGGLALLCAWHFGMNWQAASAFAFFAVLTVVACVDADTMEIPDGFVIAGLAAGILSIFAFPGIGWLERIIGVFCVSVPLFLITLVIPGAFGGGDIKLMAACGVFLGWKCSLLALFLAVVTGGFYGIWLLATKKADRKTHFAFGPFLCVGMWAAFLWGESLLAWYLGLFGI